MVELPIFASTGAGEGYILVPIFIVGFLLWAIFCQEKMTPEERKRREDDSAIASELEKTYRNKHDSNNT